MTRTEIDPQNQNHEWAMELIGQGQEGSKDERTDDKKKEAAEQAKSQTETKTDWPETI